MIASRTLLLFVVALLQLASADEKKIEVNITDEIQYDAAPVANTIEEVTTEAPKIEVTTTPVPTTIAPAVNTSKCVPPKSFKGTFACNNELDSRFICSNAEFVVSTGMYKSCQSHEDCKPYREPTNWCTLPWEYQYTQWGCYCDKKLNTCVIEREHKFTFSRQWAYCSARTNWKCNSPNECFGSN